MVIFNMSARYFEGISHAKEYAHYRVVVPESITLEIVKFLKNTDSATLQKAVDVGCGSGQSTLPLANHFEQVYGIDISEAQINEAKSIQCKSNVSFHVSPAELLPFENESVDLVTANQACHWFDLPKFYKEVDRILKPNGVLAISTNTSGILHSVIYKNKTEQLTKILEKIIYDGPLTPFIDERISYVLNELREINFPYSLQRHEMLSTKNMTLQFLIGEITTLSIWRQFQKSEGDVAAGKFLDDFVQQMMSVINEADLKTPEEVKLMGEYKFILLLGRKPHVSKAGVNVEG